MTDEQEQEESCILGVGWRQWWRWGGGWLWWWWWWSLSTDKDQSSDQLSLSHDNDLLIYLHQLFTDLTTHRWWNNQYWLWSNLSIKRFTQRQLIWQMERKVQLLLIFFLPPPPACQRCIPQTDSLHYWMEPLYILKTPTTPPQLSFEPAPRLLSIISEPFPVLPISEIRG